MSERLMLFLLRAATLLALAIVLVLLGLLLFVPMHVKPPFFPILAMGLALGLIWAGLRSDPPAQAGIGMAVGIGSLMALFTGLTAFFSGFWSLWPITLAFAVYGVLGLMVLLAGGRAAVDGYDVIKGAIGAVLLTGVFFASYLFPFLRF